MVLIPFIRGGHVSAILLNNQLSLQTQQLLCMKTFNYAYLALHGRSKTTPIVDALYEHISNTFQRVKWTTRNLRSITYLTYNRKGILRLMLLENCVQQIPNYIYAVVEKAVNLAFVNVSEIGKAENNKLGPIRVSFGVGLQMDELHEGQV
jgi:hypothetical protein